MKLASLGHIEQLKHGLKQIKKYECRISDIEGKYLTKITDNIYFERNHNTCLLI